MTEFTPMIELKRHIESSFENKTQYLDLFKEKLKQKLIQIMIHQIVF